MTLPSIVPRDILFGNPTRLAPELSPDGTRLAWIAPDRGVLNVWVRTVGEDDDRVVTSDRERGVHLYCWAYDNRHLLYQQDQGGNEDFHIYATDLTTGETRDLTPFDGVRAEIIKVHEDFPATVLLGLNRDNPQLHDVYQLDLPSGDLIKLVDNPGFAGWVADEQLQVRCGLAPRPDGGFAIMVRDSRDEEWRPVHEVTQEDALSLSPLSFDGDGKRLLTLTSAGANAGRLVWIDVTTGDLEVIAEDQTYDVTTAWLAPRTRQPRVVGFLRDRLTYEVLDPAVADDLAVLTAHDPGDLGYLGRDTADSTWLVAYNHADGPVSFWSYTRSDKSLAFLFEHQPELSAYSLADMEAFSFAARDGLTVHGYVTYPPGLERRSLPAVLDVHGGPWARDAWGFNPEAQWLANRGYACVQINFRGSTGYGKAFTNAGDGEWGRNMHTDLLDGIDHLAELGSIDKDRVAIYGGSYGGYAALVGATFTPERFVCGVDIVGPSNLKTLIESIPAYWAPMVTLFHNRIGNPETDEALLWQRSPLSRVDNISIPLLIAQGANDPRVKQAESEQIVAAMTERGIPHKYMLFADEGHGFAKPENRLKFYAEAEKFLAEHLGGRSEDS